MALVLHFFHKYYVLTYSTLVLLCTIHLVMKNIDLFFSEKMFRESCIRLKIYPESKSVLRVGRKLLHARLN